MKKYILLSVILMIIFRIDAQQRVGVNTVTPQATFHVELGNSTTNGVLFSGTINNETNFPSLGAGNRFMFYPARAALRAGTVSGTHWDNAKVGVASVAFGSNTIARSAATFATNYYTAAGGFASSTFGSYTIAKGYSSMVIGMYNDSLIVGPDEYAPSLNTPLFMIGNGNSAVSRHNAMVVYKNGNMVLKIPQAYYYLKLSQPYPIPVEGEGTRLMWLPEISAFRVGTAIDSAWNANKMGHASFATGINSTASGYISLATGLDTKASGALSTAMGYANIARGYSSTAIGMFNNPILTVDETDNATPETPLFMIGNGDGPSVGQRKNAMVVRKDGRVGIGTNVPSSLLHVNTGSSLTEGFLVQGNHHIDGTVPDLNGSSRMMFFPATSSFRAGAVTSTQWNDINVGAYSTATGYNTIASGIYSTAVGKNTIASGDGSTATGEGGIASGDYSIANGSFTKATATNSTANGIQSSARGYGSSVSGWYNVAKGFCSTVVGMYNDTLLLPNQLTSTFDTPLFIVGNGETPSILSNAMVVYKSGIVASKNRLLVSADPGTIALPTSISASGTRMMWVPEKSAFRVGSVQGSHWGGDKLGAWSFASGWNVQATGIKSTAMGSGNTASGESSIALCGSTQSSGAFSMSAGLGTISNSYAQTTIGRYNDTLTITTPNSTAWEANDALFVAGNGTGSSSAQRHNAFVIYKNGNIDIDGFTKLGDSTSTINVPSIKMKKLTGVSAGSQNAWTNVAHELNLTKILSVDIIMTVPGFVNIPPSYTYQPGYEYNYQIASSNIVVINSAANSANILTKAFTILITYQE